MSKLKTAVVGVGALGRHHLKWYSQLPQSELVGFLDTDLSKKEQYSTEYDIKAFDSLESLAEQVEAVSIVAPTTEHFKIASYLMDKGIHCLIEKPVTASLDEATKLEKIASDKGVKAVVGHIERFNPAFKMLDRLELHPSFIEAHRLAAFDPRGTDVAVVLDLMIHDIDLTLKMMNSEVVDIQSSAVAVISDKVDIANARLTFANGAVANLTASRISLQPMRKLRIFQESGYFSLDLAKKQADLYRLANDENRNEGMCVPLGKSGKDIVYVKKSDDGEDMLGAELGSFLNAVIEDKPVAVTIAEGAAALKVALEIDRIGLEQSRKVMAGNRG